MRVYMCFSNRLQNSLKGKKKKKKTYSNSKHVLVGRKTILILTRVFQVDSYLGPDRTPEEDEEDKSYKA